MTNLQKADLFEACSVLFGPQVRVSLDFLAYLQPSGLRAAYRKRALATHPDRAGALGADAGHLAGQFRQAKQAYDRLHAYVDGGAIIQAAQAHTRPQQPHPAKTAPGFSRRKARYTSFFFSGRIPRRKLLLGQFLYYAGCVSWQTFIAAITWQRRQRPPLGRIALKWGMLSDDEIKQVLKTRHNLEKFGQSALRRGYLNQFELMALLGKQRRMQRPIGEYFIARGELTPLQLRRMLLRQEQHNNEILKVTRFRNTG